MNDKEKKRAELRIIKKYIKVENKQSKFEIKNNLEKSYRIQDKMA